MAYYKLEPFGEERADFRTGLAAFRLAAFWCAKGHQLRLEDFMPDFDKPIKSRETKQQTVEEMRQTMDLFVSALRRK